MVSSSDRFKFLPTLILLLIFMASTAPAMTLSLSEAIQAADRNSYTVQASRHDSLAASYDYKAARSARYPSLSIEARSSFADNIPSIEFPGIGARDLGAKENYQADIKLTVPLFTGGRIASRIRANCENVLADAFALEAERMNTAYNCRRAYLATLLSEAVALSAEASLKRIDIIRRNVADLHTSGLADSIDILETELAYQQMQLTVSEKQTAAANARLNLALILGLPPDTNVQLTEKITPPSKDLSVISSPAPIDRPELKMLDSKIRSAEHLIRLNRSEYFPEISGYAGYSYGKPNRDFFNNKWDDYWTAGLALKWELNLGGGTSHRTNAAHQAAGSIRMSKNDLERSLTILAETSAQNVDLAYRTVLTTQKEYDIARNKYRLAEKKQKAGLLTVNRLLEIEAELTASEQQYRASIVNFYIVQSEHLYAVGSEKIYGGL